MNSLFAGIAGIVAAEAMVHLPLGRTASDIIAILNKAVSVIRAPAVSDRWKEKALRMYSLIILLRTLKLACYLLVIASPVALVALIRSISGENFLQFLMTVKGGLILSTISLGYFMARKHFA